MLLSIRSGDVSRIASSVDIPRDAVASSCDTSPPRRRSPRGSRDLDKLVWCANVAGRAEQVVGQEFSVFVSVPGTARQWLRALRQSGRRRTRRRLRHRPAPPVGLAPACGDLSRGRRRPCRAGLGQHQRDHRGEHSPAGQRDPCARAAHRAHRTVRTGRLHRSASRRVDAPEPGSADRSALWVAPDVGRGNGPVDDGLTDRQVEVLTLIEKGRTNAEIAIALAITEHTVVSHIRHIFDKANLVNRAQGGCLTPSVAAWADRASGQDPAAPLGHRQITS